MRYLANFILWYLRILAKIQLRKINPIIIGVGGSSGKSSLCTLLSIVLAEKYRVKQSKGKNSETGIPLDILGIEMRSFSKIEWLKVVLIAPFQLLINWRKYDIYIAEMGIDSPVEPKNMSYLLKIIHPDIGIVTNVSLEHSQYFDFLVTEKNQDTRVAKILELTAEQELLLLTSLKKENIAVVNIEDTHITEKKKEIIARPISIGVKNKFADYDANKIQIELHSFSVIFTHDKKEYVLKISELLPEHYAYSFLFAIAVAKALNIDIEQSIYSLQNHLTLPPGRSTVFAGIKHTTIIDSSYNNATLPPLLDMLSLLHRIGKGRRKVAILGDMRELGSMSKYNHEKAAEHILKTIDFAILIGPLMQQFVAPILSQHEFQYKSFLTFTEAKTFILQTIKPRDIILVKSSQNTLFLERVVAMLLANPDDKKLLCRRGAFWERKRLETP